MSATGNKFKTIKFQIDTASTCNTVSEETLKLIDPQTKISHSPYVLYPYGDSKPIKPLGQVKLVCERKNKFEMLNFQVLKEEMMQNKPALLSGSDSERLGVVNIFADEVYTLQTISKAEVKPGNLTKEDITIKYKDLFQGLGQLGPPVRFTLKENMHPVQMPIHRVPVMKKEKEKAAIDRYVKEGILKKVEEPTPWCSNELIRETPSKFRICIDPSQTINKAILRPIYQMPTLEEQLHKLSKAKIVSVIDVKDGFLHVPLDE